jgi:hypothetical protein
MSCAACGNVSPIGPSHTSSSPRTTTSGCGSADVLGCGLYTSISGKDAGNNDLPWIAAQPLTMTIAMMNGTRTVVMDTPCNALNVPVAVTKTMITPDASAMIAGTMGCLGTNGDEEAWVRQFLGQPIMWSRNNAGFTLTNGIGTIEFTDAATSG